MVVGGAEGTSAGSCSYFGCYDLALMEVAICIMSMPSEAVLRLLL